MPSDNGERPSGPLELSEVLYIKTKDGAEMPFEVVGILEDPDDGSSYAVLMHEPEEESEGEFIVTDLEGNLVDDEELAQEILDEFLVFAEEAGDDGGAKA
ncbi:MAG TPA: hypothetical protein VFE36_12630 [Candidatus Baltobacteraceae bacterium]|jgi:uncharacterized protein YrzB (UPF0473 family)|nr:hypothetical protein [Candidatus Baltobacteraceae bacterium]